MKLYGLILSRNWLVFCSEAVEEKLEQGTDWKSEASFIGNRSYANLRTQSKLKTNCSVAERLP